MIISSAERSCQQASASGGAFGTCAGRFRSGAQRVVIQHYQELIRYLSRTLGDRQVAADLAQESFARLLERKARDVIEQPRAFLFRTAINLSIDLHRRTRVRDGEPLDSLDREGRVDDCDPQEQASQAQQLALLRRALDELPTACRQAFLLRKMEGCSHAEIAERLGISAAMVEKHVVNAMRHCRQRLRQWAG